MGVLCVLQRDKSDTESHLISDTRYTSKIRVFSRAVCVVNSCMVTQLLSGNLSDLSSASCGESLGFRTMTFFLSSEMALSPP